jgi:hypothetical protein
MVGTKVLCIDADWPSGIPFGAMLPLIEGATYTIRGINKYPGGDGYLLEEIKNEYNIRYHPELEPGYAPRRFVLLSDKDETELMELEYQFNHQ